MTGPNLEYPDHVRQLEESRPALAAEVRDMRGLGAVMAWMAARGIPLSEAEIVQQDEFSLDFVIPLARESAFLAFGIT